jgi:hypothetical protein
MAIIFQFNVIVARKAEIDAKYSGGLAHFRVQWLAKPPERWCEDEHLLAFSSMGAHYGQVRDALRAAGIDVVETSEAAPPDQVISRCGWLDWNIHHKLERPYPGGLTVLDVAQYWLRGGEPGEVAPFKRH